MLQLSDIKQGARLPRQPLRFLLADDEPINLEPFALDDNCNVWELAESLVHTKNK